MTLERGRKTVLTDLELTVLGIVRKRAPCTAYAVMREFSSSPSSYYRGSAGAIYPLVRRLEKSGHLEAREGRQGRRPRRTYALAATGLEALRNWLLPPLPDAAAAITFDPIRTRSYFLAVLDPAEQLAFVVDAEKRLEAQLALNEAEVARYRRAGDEFSALAMSGAVRVVQARIAWLADLREHFSGS